MACGPSSADFEAGSIEPFDKVQQRKYYLTKTYSSITETAMRFLLLVSVTVLISTLIPLAGEIQKDNIIATYVIVDGKNVPLQKYIDDQITDDMKEKEDDDIITKKLKEQKRNNPCVLEGKDLVIDFVLRDSYLKNSILHDYDERGVDIENLRINGSITYRMDRKGKSFSLKGQVDKGDDVEGLMHCFIDDKTTLYFRHINRKDLKKFKDGQKIRIHADKLYYVTRENGYYFTDKVRYEFID